MEEINNTQTYRLFSKIDIPIKNKLNSHVQNLYNSISRVHNSYYLINFVTDD